MPFATTWMDLEIIILSEVRKRKTAISCDTTYMQNLKYDTNKLIYKIETDSQAWRTNLWLPKRKGGGRGINLEFEIGRYTLLHIK